MDTRVLVLVLIPGPWLCHCVAYYTVLASYVLRNLLTYSCHWFFLRISNSDRDHATAILSVHLSHCQSVRNIVIVTSRFSTIIYRYISEMVQDRAITIKLVCDLSNSDISNDRE